MTLVVEPDDWRWYQTTRQPAHLDVLPSSVRVQRTTENHLLFSAADAAGRPMQRTVQSAGRSGVARVPLAGVLHA